MDSQRRTTPLCGMISADRDAQNCDGALAFVAPQELWSEQKFPIYNIGSAENNIFLTFSQKNLSIVF